MKSILSVLAVLCFALVGVAQDKAEAAFLKDGPKLYTMADALKVSETTGKPVVCWMGKHLFANEEARELSKSLGNTTIQAVMDSDGTADDQAAPFRVKFSDGGYKKSAKTYYIPISQFRWPGAAETILRVSRGGK